jgi:YegS/Rv2252/BmrU family lipid kinase
LNKDQNSSRKRFLIIHNPIAGMRRRWMLHEVCRHLRARGAKLTIVEAEGLDDDRRLASEAARSRTFDAVIAAGGDSTVRGVATGLVGTELPLGIISVGTGNVLVHEIGMRHGPRAVGECLMEGPTIPITMGSANDHPFALMAGVGFDARVLARLDTAWKRRMGKLAYLWAVLSELVARPPFFEVSIDGQVRHCTWLIVTKAKRYGGPFQIAPEQHLQSERFSAVIINARTGLELAGVVLAIGLGRAEKHPQVEIISCSRVVVPRGQTVATQLDGEVFTPPPLDIRMDPRSLQLIVSPDFQAQPVAQSEGDLSSQEKKPNRAVQP